MNRRNERRAGFTLLETVIALAIFTIGIVALYGVQTRSITQNSSANRMTASTSWASDRVEFLMSLDYKDLKDSNNGVDNTGLAGLDSDTPATADGNESSPDGVYTMLWNVADNEPIYGTKRIRIIVTTVQSGPGKRVDLDYIKHR